MIITKIKIGRMNYNITKDDRFLHDPIENVTTLETQRGPLFGWYYQDVVLTEQMVAHINTFSQKEHKTNRPFYIGCRLFSITAKETTC